ncbi:hypothetical protein ASZ90_009952 [hydrocarbon metagenome]|uniref:Uncharacterized protein n=1 Tax=hydrocarbon metagenome TaxID=938273 RepID=A0A0W8FHB3_9ZZZZ
MMPAARAAGIGTTLRGSLISPLLMPPVRGGRLLCPVISGCETAGPSGKGGPKAAGERAIPEEFCISRRGGRAKLSLQPATKI